MNFAPKKQNVFKLTCAFTMSLAFTSHELVGGDDLQARLVLYSQRVVVGEPLIATVVVTNAGPSKVPTPYCNSERLRHHADMNFIVSLGTNTVLTVGGGGSGAKSIWREGVGLDPGAAVRAKKVVPLILAQEQGKAKLLEAGSYSLRVAVPIVVYNESNAQWVTLHSPDYEFTVQACDQGDVESLDIWSSLPGLAALLQGRAGKLSSVSTDVAARLKKRSPTLPHHKYLGARLVQSELQHPSDEDLNKPRTSLAQYLNDYPDSPFKDDLLFYLGCLEEIKTPETVEGITSVAATFERILKECPDSPLTAEVEAKLTKLRRLLAEAAAPSE